jgi:hypothetical protein
MTDDQQRDEQPKEPGREERSSSTEPPSDQKEKFEEMERGIDRVGDHIDEAKEEAEHAQTLDPRPMTGNEDGLNSTD